MRQVANVFRACIGVDLRDWAQLGDQKPCKILFRGDWRPGRLPRLARMLCISSYLTVMPSRLLCTAANAALQQNVKGDQMIVNYGNMSQSAAGGCQPVRKLRELS
jgi:hypothetical protein